MGMTSFGVGICVNSIENAAEFYTKIFGFELKGIDLFPEGDPNCGKYMHAEMWKDGKCLFAIQGLSESERDFDAEKQIIKFGAWFNNEMELREAFDLLSDGGIVKDPFGTVESWSPCCATVIDKYGITWWISIVD